MKLQLETLENSEVKLTVELTAEEMGEYQAKATKALQEEVKVDGFRPGHIPMEMLQKQMGQDSFNGYVVEMALSESYEKAIQEKDLRPVGYPKISITQQSPLIFEATLPVVPELKWKKELSELTLKAKEIKIDQKDIDQVLDNLKKGTAKWKDVERAAKKGDRAEIDFDGFDEGGATLEGTSSKNHPVVLGENTLIPGFEDEIVGMKVGEEKDFEITFPKDYHSASFQGKKVKFHIKLNRLEEAELPEINDEFAKEITGGNRKNMDELLEEIKEELTKQRERENMAELEQEYLKQLLDYVDVTVPQAMTDREIEFMIGRIKEDLKRRNVTWEDYEKEMADKKKDIRKDLEKPAREQVTLRLALEKLYEEQDVPVTDEELEAEIQLVVGMYPPQLAPMLRERYNEGTEGREYLERQIRLRKLVKKSVR